MSLAVVCPEFMMSVSAINEYVVLLFNQEINIQYVPSYIRPNIVPAFQEVVADVDGAVVPYLLIAIAPVPFTFKVGFAIEFVFVNLTNIRTPVYNWNVESISLQTLSFVARAVPHVP